MHGFTRSILLSCLLAVVFSKGHHHHHHDEGEDEEHNEGFNLYQKEGILSSSSFPDIKHAQKIKLKSCRYSSISSDVCSAIPGVRNLIIDDSTIQNFDEGLLKGCSNLKIIKIWNSNVDIKGLSQLPNIRVLDIGKSHIGDLKRGILSGCSGLEFVSLKECDIENIEPDTFNGLHNLIKLHLEKNKIQSFSFSNLPQLSKLECISLSDNPLTTLDVSTVKQKCPNLTTLILKNVNLQPSVLQELKKLNIEVEQ